MNAPEYISDLLVRFFDGTASDEEKTTILNWLKEDAENVKEFERLEALWTLSSSVRQNDSETETALVSFKKRKEEAKNDRKAKTIKLIINRVYSIAAIIIVIFGITATIYMLKDDSEKPTLSYFETYIPKKQRGQMTLPDGTKIWLNSDTKIKYSSSFNSLEKREVFLQGEAYFEVAKNKEKPFYVYTNKLTVNVLGTTFNVKSYPNDKEVETALVEGSVKIINVEGSSKKEYLLKPNERAVFKKDKQSMTIQQLQTGSVSDEPKTLNDKKKEEIHLETIVSWRKEQLIFENETFESIAVKLERWFNLKITIENEKLKNDHFTGKFINNETIYQILNIINETTPIHYVEKDKEINIKSKK